MPENEKHLNKEVPKIASTTTPTTICNPCKFRGRTIEILGILSNSGGMTTREIADRTGIPIKIVNVYCWQGEKRGIFERKERWGWKITPFGLYILGINNNNNNNNKSSINKILIRDKSNINQNYIVPKKPRQLNLDLFRSRSDITESERVVVEVLAKHYERTGEKYRYFKDIYYFCNETGINAEDAIEVIAKLKEEGCIYARKDELGWKIGLKVGFVKTLEIC